MNLLNNQRLTIIVLKLLKIYTKPLVFPYGTSLSYFMFLAFLGSYITKDLKLEVEVKRRCGFAKAAFGKMKRIFTDKTLKSTYNSDKNC